MAVMTIRNLDDDVRDKLRVRAAQHGRSMEAEVRAILTAAVESPAEKSLVDLLIELGDAAGPDFADFLPPREPYESPVDFS